MEDGKKKSYSLEDPEPAFQVNSEESGISKKWIAIVVLVVVVVAVAVTVPTVLLTMKKEEAALPIGGKDRIECPFMGEPHYDGCIKKGCEWSPASNAPSCSLPKASNYFVIGSRVTTNDGFIVPIGYESNVTLFASPYMNAHFKVSFQDENQLTFEIIPDNSSVLSVPTRLSFSPIYEVIVDDVIGLPFNFAVRRKDDFETIWNSSINGLVLEKQFLQISTHLASENIYGLGENDHSHFKRDLNYEAWTMFSRHSNDKQKEAGGFHPFFLCLENSGKAHSVFFDNTHAIEYVLLPAPAITFRTIGGTLKFTMFLGNSPNEVVRSSSKILGTPEIIPYWSLGFQITPKTSYSSEEFKAVVEKVKTLIPLDAVYLDPILWDDGKVFDKQFIKDGIYDYVNSEHGNNGIHFVMTLDPGIRTREYSAFNTGLNEQVFVEWSSKVVDQISDDLNTDKLNNSLFKKYVFGTREPDRGEMAIVAYPDFSKPSTQSWWVSLLENLRKSVVFDGIYLVGNQPYNNGTNERCDLKSCWSLVCPGSEWDDPPYVPGGLNRWLSDGTLCMSATLGNTLHYEAHNLYGVKMVEASAKHFITRSERTFVISQSTSSRKSQGNPVGHWLPPADRSWNGLRKTIVGLLDFSLFGIPYVGAQICGDGKITISDLCKRWIQLAAFYPFLKVDVAHSNIIDQNLSGEGGEALATRMSLLPYMYTVFYQSHLTGDPVIRPLFYEYPEDKNVYSIDKQFLWGDRIMVAPILEEGISSMDVYFPNDTWYRMRKEASTIVTYTTGQYSEVGEIRDLPVYVRGGTIIASHSEDLKSNIRKSRADPMVLKVFPNEGRSSGFLFWDDGNSKDTLKTSRFLTFSFTHNMCEITIQRTNYYDSGTEKLIISQVMIHDAGNAQNVFVNGRPGQVFQYSSRHRILFLRVDIVLSDVTLSEWTISWHSGGQCLRGDSLNAEGPTPSRLLQDDT